MNRTDRRDRNRRRRWQTKVHFSSVSRGCRAWLQCLAERSSDTAKPVWGNQVKQGKEIRCSARQVRRYRAEAEAAGLIETTRAEPERLPDGTFTRALTNIYRFCVPPARSKQQKSRSHQADMSVLSNHQTTFDIETLRTTDIEIEPDDPIKPFSSRPPGGFKALKALIGR